MNENYKKIAIKCNSRAEKVAAMYHLSSVSGVRLDSIDIANAMTSDPEHKHPFVMIYNFTNPEIGIASDSAKDLLEIEFSKLATLDNVDALFPNYIEVDISNCMIVRVFKNHDMTFFKGCGASVEWTSISRLKGDDWNKINNAMKKLNW